MVNSAKEHIEKIRRERYWIGRGEKNQLCKSLSRAVKYLSTELYSKDVHFLMELVQNAEDNEYPERVEPSLEFMVTSKDITATGAPATLLIFNNEKGFSRKNMESICDVGDSTKAGNRKRGYIGEKGIGFKSVFLLTSHPYIFSNGYQIRFSETPCSECDLAYIVPEWVDSKPSVSDIEKIYGQNKMLPTTTLILPLKPDKVKAVKDQLSSLHPELLLFLSKIKLLSVKEVDVDAHLSTVRAISISCERDFVARKSINAESYTVHLMAGDIDDRAGECSYYMWRQRFPVKKENRVERRIDSEEVTITLAFPFGMRLNRGMTSVGIYAFLPTELVTNLPFIIQADFLLPSSRETILWDDVWNEGILDCVPTAFINAFVSLVKSKEDAPTVTLARMFVFLPIKSSCHPKLNMIRESIRVKLLQEYIIPSESHSTQKFFHKPQEVGRLMPSFWNVLLKAKSQGAKLHNLSSLGKHILDSSFDTDEYNDVLDFLGIKFVEHGWYPKCIQNCNLVLGVEEDIYIELLYFISGNWISQRDVVQYIPLLKYVDVSGNVSLLSIYEAQTQYTLCLSENTQYISWLIDWSKEFQLAGNLVFLPVKTQKLCFINSTLLVWMKDHRMVKTLDVFGYASLLHKSLGNNRQLVLTFAHFIYLSFSKGFIEISSAKLLCRAMPLVNSGGIVIMKPMGVLVPANGSNWVDLMGSNPWINEGYAELYEGYLNSWQYDGQYVPKNAVITFLRNCSCAHDIPDICPPNAPFPTVSGPLTKQNALLLLDWIRKLRSKSVSIPSKFLSSVKNGSWLRVTMSGSPGYKSPSESFLPSSSWESLLQNGSDLVDIPLVDKSFYGNVINEYEEELKSIGLMVDCGQACEFIAHHLMSLAANYNLTATKVISMLNFIKFLREKYMPSNKFVDAIKNVRWVNTSIGERLPSESVLYDDSWKAAIPISQIPFINQDYYGSDILKYKAELDLLGILVCFKQNYSIVIDHFKPSTCLSYLRAEPLLLALQCIRNSNSSGKLAESLKKAKCLRTNDGYLNPVQCYLFDQEWGCILEVFDGFPFIDSDFYGNEIFDYKHELENLEVVVEFDVAMKAFCNEFKHRASLKSITKENALSFLFCYRKLRNLQRSLPTEFTACAREAKWLKTRFADFRSPKECILCGPIWQPISHVTVLPFINDSDEWYGNGINCFKQELESFGVVVDFEKGAKLVFKHILFPQDPTNIKPDSVISLLDCIRNYNKQSQRSLPEDFLKKIHGTKWLKTTSGYKSPKECLLFDPNQRFLLQREDGPFIDEEYYGPAISSYKVELDAIGVTIAMRGNNYASSLLSHHLSSQSEFTKIVRIYDFLRETDWRPVDGVKKYLWVPTSSNHGRWVSPKECVLNDDNGLFTSKLHVLDKHYEKKLLLFFHKVFEVKRSASTEDYCNLWIEWENETSVVSHNECCAFWEHICAHWNSETEKMMSEVVSKLPAVSPASNDIHLVNKQDVFLPDDLLLKDLFDKSSPQPLFVWFPRIKQPFIPRARLHDIYAKIGVGKISKSVSISEFSTSQCDEINGQDASIVKGLVILILGFLADPSLNIEVKSRHQIVEPLLNVSVFKTSDPITVSYNLMLGSGKIVKASTSQMVRWERKSLELFTQKVEKSGRKRNLLEYATRFSEAVANGLLWEKEDQIPRLVELIKFGFLVDFDEDAIVYFIKSKNIEICSEDEEFLASAFPPC